MPEMTSVGCRPRRRRFTESRTQSGGVPSTANRRGPSLRTRSGRCSVSEWLAPLCSSSGATVQTSRQSWRTSLCRILRPRASMPSSLVRRIRAWPRSIGRSNIAADHLEPAHVRLERVGHRNRAVTLLIVLEYRNQRAPDREPGAVERVHEPRPLPFRGPEPRLHAARLEVAAVGAAGDLAIGALTGQPNLDVIGLTRGEAHVARAQQHHAVGEPEALQDLLGAVRHPLVLLGGAVGMCDRDQLDLVELVLPDHAASVLAGGARLGAKARRPRGEAQRQLLLLEDLVGHQIGERHLRRRNEPEAGRSAEQVLGELGQAARAVDGLAADQYRRRDLGVAELARVSVDHELRKRALEPRELPAQHHEARARDLARAGEVHEADPLADLSVIFRLEGEVCGRAVPAHFAVRRRIGPVWHVVGWDIGNACERRLDRAIARRGLGLQHGLTVLAGGDLPQDRAGVLALGFGAADLLREPVALGLDPLGLGLRFSPGFIEGEDLRRLRSQTAPRQALVEGRGIVANPFEIEHGSARVRARPVIEAGPRAVYLAVRSRSSPRPPPPPPRAPHAASTKPQDTIEI